MLMVILPKLPSFWAQPVPASVMAVMQAPGAAPIGTWSPRTIGPWSPCRQCLCPLCPGFPPAHCIQWWHQRARRYFTRTLQPCVCRGEARGVTRGVTTCSCSGECYLVRRRSGDGDARQLSIETFITQFFNGCATQLTIAWRRKRFTFCQQIHYTEAETSFF